MTGSMVSRKVSSAAVSTPLLAVPPSSDRVTVTTVVPFWPLSVVKVRLPDDVSTAGCTENNVVSSTATAKVSTWPDSLSAPLPISAAQVVSYAPLSSPTVTVEPAVKTGTSFTELTVTRKVWSAAVSTPLLAVPPSSDRVTVTREVPNWSSAGVKVRVPLVALTAGCTLKSVVSPATTVKVNTWPDSLVAPLSMAVAQLAVVYPPLSSSTVTSAPPVKLGTSFLTSTVSRKVTVSAVSSPLLAVPPSSDRMTVTIVVPNSSAAGSKVRLPLLVSTAGWTLNRVVSLAVTAKVSTSSSSSASAEPLLIPVAQPAS